MNLFEGRAANGVIEVGRHGVISADDASGDVFVLIHPRAVSLHRHQPDGSPRNVWAGTVADIDLERDRGSCPGDRPDPTSRPK